MEVRLADGRSATYEVLGNGPPLLSFVGGPGMPARFMRPDARLFAEPRSIRPVSERVLLLL